MTTYGYIRTSRQRIQGTAGSDPEAQAHQLRQEGVPEANIYRDVGVSGGTGTNSRAGWRDLNARLVSGDILVVVAIDRIGRRWMDTVNAVRDLRAREVRIRSLAQSEATWVTYLAAEPDTAEAVIGDILTTFMAWAAEQELQAVSRRTRAGLERARAEGKTLGPPPRVDDDQVEAMARLRREGQSFRSIGRVFGVSRTTVQRRLQEQEAGNLEDSQTPYEESEAEAAAWPGTWRRGQRKDGAEGPEGGTVNIDATADCANQTRGDWDQGEHDQQKLAAGTVQAQREADRGGDRRA